MISPKSEWLLPAVGVVLVLQLPLAKAGVERCSRREVNGEGKVGESVSQ